jgi:hypothetical protein
MTADGEDFIGTGLVPDVEVLDRAAAIAQGRDLSLEKAVSFLWGQSQ